MKIGESAKRKLWPGPSAGQTDNVVCLQSGFFGLGLAGHSLQAFRALVELKVWPRSLFRGNLQVPLHFFSPSSPVS